MLIVIKLDDYGNVEREKKKLKHSKKSLGGEPWMENLSSERFENTIHSKCFMNSTSISINDYLNAFKSKTF